MYVAYKKYIHLFQPADFYKLEIKFLSYIYVLLKKNNNKMKKELYYFSSSQ